ncbi:MAG: hypothetical protein JXB26_02160 [Candidatus Aminicenantes bacterium]|nr:hypothetical protein [Candidatus Aminicenantes bacterium]
MKKTLTSGVSFLTIIFLSLTAFPFSHPEIQELEKKYAPITGVYEFDLSDAGYGILTIEFYVDNNSIWAQSSVGSTPGEMIPVEGKEFVFTIEDPDEGMYEVSFIKNEEGKYTKCRVKNDNMGMDVVGTKLE